MQKFPRDASCGSVLKKEHLDVISCWIERATDGSPGEGISRTLQMGAAEREGLITRLKPDYILPDICSYSI